MTLLGPELKVGDKAPDFDAIDDSLKPVTLATTAQSVGYSGLALWNAIGSWAG